MTATGKMARVGGLVYLLETAVAPIRNFYIPGKLFVPANAALTAAHIAAHESPFRIGKISDLPTGLLSLLVVLALYRLLQRANRPQARLMVILGGLMITPRFFVNTLNDPAVLSLCGGSHYVSAFGRNGVDELVQLFLTLHRQGVRVNEVFWALWLFPFGVLMYRSQFLPKFLGVLAFVNGFASLVMSVTGLLFPRRERLVSQLLFPALTGEVVIMLWLLVMGTRDNGAPGNAPLQRPPPILVRQP